jgi:hypothetical protein
VIAFRAKEEEAMNPEMRRYIVAVVIALVLIGAFTGLAAMMRARMDYYMEADVAMPAAERVMIALAIFWSAFWWLLSPVILLGCLGLVGLHHLLRPARQSGSK